MEQSPGLNAVWARALADALARAGLRHAVIAPGSRSTPLVLAFAEHPDIADHSVIDERSAAFFALGIARASGAPAAVVTTSGTAAANLLPAVAEADRAGVPLLLLTADRPPELRDAGDSQSIDQVKMFGSFVRWFHGVAEPSLEDGRLAYLRSTACEAWARALGAAGGDPGPVHLNLPFRKPLEPADGEGGESDRAGESGGIGGSEAVDSGAAGRTGRAEGAPWRRTTAAPGEPDRGAIEELALALVRARRPLVLVGSLTETGPGADPDPLRAAVARVLTALPLPVWAEATSNLRGTPGVVGTADVLLASAGFRRLLHPMEGGGIDLVVRIGEAPITWPLRRFSAGLEGAGVELWSIDRYGRRHDPGHAVARSIAADPARTLDAVAAWLERHPAAANPDRNAWTALHRNADRAARGALAAFAEDSDGELFDGGVFPRLAHRLPEDAALVVSSSMPLRELEAFFPGPLDDRATGGDRDLARPIDVFANRGANGIDGVTSTAAGIAQARSAGGESRTLLVTGDVAFAHDLSGTLAAGRLSSDLTVVLIDNGGGAIFDHLPLAALPAYRAAFERHFTTPPGVDFGPVARGLGWTFTEVEGWAGFDGALDEALAARGGLPRLIRVATDRARSKALREAWMKTIGEAIDGALAAAGELAPGASPTASAATKAVTKVDPASPARPHAEPGAPVLLLHGFTGSGTGPGIAALAEALRAAGHPVIAPDLLGHGSAPVPEAGATMDAAVAAALDALDRRGISRVAWVGYSMGGRVALAAALDHPERVAGLVLLSASPGIESESGRAVRRESDEALALSLETHGLAPFVDRWMAQPLFARQAALGHRHLRRARAERLGGSARGYAASLRGMGQGVQPSYWARLAELRAPTLLVAGAEDETYVAIARRMAEAVPGARTLVVPGAGHAVHLEAPEAVARAILETLARLGGE